MKNTPEDFEKLVSALSNALQKQDENIVQEDYIEELASSMGWSHKEFQALKSGFLERGNKHLKHKNWEEAIREYEQCLFFSPQNDQAMLSMAESHFNLWLKTGEKDTHEKARQFAEKTIQINPKLDNAYKIIQQIKEGLPAKQGKNTYQKHKSTTFSKDAKVWFLTVILCSALGIGISFFQDLDFSIFSTPREVNKMMVVIGSKGSTGWNIFYNPGNDSLAKAEIVNPETNTVIKEIEISKPTSDLFIYDDKVYYLTKGNFEARNIYDGTLLESVDILANKHPELKVGAANVDRRAYFLNFRFTLKNGDVYAYNPVFDFLVKESEITSLSVWRREKYDYYQWAMQDSKKSSNHKNVYLHNKKSSADQYIGYENSDLHYFNERSQITRDSPDFLKGELLYGDSTYCIVKHVDELGEKPPIRLTCLNKEAKTLWQLKEEDIQNKTFLEIVKYHENSLEFSRKGTTLVMYINWGEYDKGYALNITNGKLLWEYTP